MMFDVLYKRGLSPAAVYVKKRFNPLKLKDPNAQYMFATGVRIHAWVYVTVGNVRFKNIAAMQLPPIKINIAGVKVDSEPPIPLRCDTMKFPNNDVAAKANILFDEENERAKTKFIRTGLWYSAPCGGGTLLGHDQRIYIIPYDDSKQLLANLETKGCDVLSAYPSFADPTPDLPDTDLIVMEEEPPKSEKWWQFWK